MRSHLGDIVPMRGLRLIILAVWAPYVAAAQSVAEDGFPAGVEVTSGVINEATLPDVPDDVAEDVAVLVAPEEDEEVSPLAPGASLRPVMRDAWAVPAARWDDHPDGPAWTAAFWRLCAGPVRRFWT